MTGVSPAGVNVNDLWYELKAAAAREPMNPVTSPVVEDQSEVIAWLADPASHGCPVRRIDTHASIVVLAGERAYKLKRAVRYPFLDYGTVGLRRDACRAEVALNRRTAPAIYQGVAAIVRRAGRLMFGPLDEDAADALDWVVVMRRFDEATLFDRLAATGRLTPELAERAAETIGRFHLAAERRTTPDGASGLAWVIDDNEAELGAEPGLDAAAVRDLGRACRDRLAAGRDLLASRARAGFVRVCHGDLHLRNICLVNAEPTLFDAIEFNDRLSVIDIAYDLAFLLMDLEHRGLRAPANLVLNRWQAMLDDLESLALLPLFLALRAAVRAKVEAATARLAGDSLDAARAYLSRAAGFLRPHAPVLVAVGGLSGSGKTTLARALAPLTGPSPGAIHLRSDTLRKRLAGVGETDRLPESAYTEEANERVFAGLRADAARALAAHHAVVVDAVHATPEERGGIEAVARDAGAAFVGLWLESPEDVLLRRVERRVHDASDADAAVVRRQLGYDLGAIGWHRLEAGAGAEATLARAAALVP